MSSVPPVLPLKLLIVNAVTLPYDEYGNYLEFGDMIGDGMQLCLREPSLSRPKHLLLVGTWVNDGADTCNQHRYILDGDLLAKLYNRVMAIRASAGRTKRKRACQWRDAIVPVTTNRCVTVAYCRDYHSQRMIFYIGYGDTPNCIPHPCVSFRLFADDLTVCTGVPMGKYDGRPLANPGWAKVRRAVCAWAVALAWQRVADTEALARAEQAMATTTEAAKAAVEVASGLIAKYADAQSTAGKAVMAAAERVAGLAMAPGGAVAMGFGEHFEAVAIQQQ